MVIDKRDSEGVKLSFEVKLIGGCSVQIHPIQIHKNIGNFPNSVFYICSNGYVFEKSYYQIKYSQYRLIIPPYIDHNREKVYQVYSFNTDQERYYFLKKLKNDLLEYTKSGAFGYNPQSRVLTYSNFWFVY